MKARILFLLGMLLVSLSTSMALFAQQDTPAEDNSAESEQSSTPSEPGANDDIVTADAAPVADPEETPVASNEDFNPSVQISEDLSVSFPVDI